MISKPSDLLVIGLPIGLILLFIVVVSFVLIILLVACYRKAKIEAKHNEIEELEALNNGSDLLRLTILLSTLLYTGEIMYDVFLSFANEDEEITVEKIKNPLEELGYEVCWHHRDFVAGMTINDNMTSCIGASRMIVVVLSKAFERSKFCIDELQIANLKRKQTRKRCIVPVLVEKCQLPIDMDKFTYIPIERKDFLRKLCRDLGKT